METPHQKQTIIIIAIIAVVVIAGLFFIGSRVVGQAVSLPSGSFAGIEGKTGGIAEKIAVPKAQNQQIRVPVGVRLGAGEESVAFSFKLYYPSDKLTFENVDAKMIEGDVSKPNDDWGNDFLRWEDKDNYVSVEHATLNFKSPLNSDGQLLAEVNFRVKVDSFNDPNSLRLDEFKVLNLNDPTANLLDGVQIVANGVGDVQTQECEDPVGAELTALCIAAGLRQCAGGDFNADLDGNGMVNEGDVAILKLGFLAGKSIYSECGDSVSNQLACHFGSIYICDNFVNEAQSFNCGGVAE